MYSNNSYLKNIKYKVDAPFIMSKALNSFVNNEVTVDIRKTFLTKLFHTHSERQQNDGALKPSIVYYGGHYYPLSTNSTSQLGNKINDAQIIEADLNRKISVLFEYAKNTDFKLYGRLEASERRLDNVSSFYGVGLYQPKSLDYYENLNHHFRALSYLTQVGIIESSWHNELLDRFDEILKTKKLLKLLKSEIGYLIAKIRKTLRNYRRIFKKLHSFHFKNLDDYHSLTLTFGR